MISSNLFEGTKGVGSARFVSSPFSPKQIPRRGHWLAQARQRVTRSIQVVALFILGGLALAGYGFSRIRATRNEKASQFTKIFNR